MHIKQVIIRGFKTYKDQVSLAEDFHPGVNVVVGFNGSGKTNFFNAILFVISDHFGVLRQETRKALLHEGAGPAVLTAFVEIVFDNRDRRLPIERDDVRVRRTIGAKKDDYSLEGKTATKAEIFSLLESCGFTKTNPYYIVQQGKISELTLMNDARRLELLKEISGAAVYDERRTESERLLEEVQARRQKTDEIIEAISQRIKSLEEEQKELVEYQKLEKQRRGLEYELADRDWRTAQERIESLEAERREAAGLLHQAQREATTLKQDIQEAEIEVSEVEGHKGRLTAERGEAERMRSSRLEDFLRAKLELADEKKRTEDGRKSREEKAAEVAKLQEEVVKVRKELDEQRPQLALEQSARKELMEKRRLSEAERIQLLAKQGRGAQHSSIQERNKALTEEIARRKLRMDQAAKALKESERELRRSQDGAKACRLDAEDARNKITAIENQLKKDLGPELARLGEQLEKIAEQRRLLMQDKELLSREKEEAQRQVDLCHNRIENTMSRPQRTALNEVRRWAERQNLQEHVYGTLLENIEVPPEYCVAAESTAGAALFNLLVRDDDIAGQIVSLVRKGSLGSIVCTPMNQLVNRTKQYPKVAGVKALVDVVSCPEWALPAVQQVFGRTVVCQSLELCEEVSRKYGLDAITLDGDKVSSRGTLTGGYQDPSRFVRLQYAAKGRKARENLQTIGPKMQANGEKVAKAGQMLDELHQKRRDLQEKRAERRTELAQTIDLVQDKGAQAVSFDEAIRRYTERIDELQPQITEHKAAVQALETEMGSKSVGVLTAAEEQELNRLTEQLTTLEAELQAREEHCHQQERIMKGREQHLQGFLQRQLDELQGELLRDTQADHEEALREKGQAVIRLEREHGQACELVTSLDEQLAEVDSILAGRREALEQAQGKEQQHQVQVSQATSRLDEIEGKLKAVARKKGDADDKLRGLALVSSDVARYREMTPAQLVKELGKTTKALGKFEHVNKKAIDQFATFQDQLQDLQQKRKDIEESYQALQEFMKQVDRQKDEILQQTLERVDRHFGEIFADLVRGGLAKLRMLSPEDRMEDEGPLEEGGTKGVRIEVSFTGQRTSFLTMAQLSGGQKTVVAISLIFAIQRLEPAPFYLFDEIDAALDNQYRAAVARLIAKDSQNGAQMVITTFRPELIDTADRFYRVYQKNRVSRIECVPRQEAQRVIEEQTRIEHLDN